MSASSSSSSLVFSVDSSLSLSSSSCRQFSLDEIKKATNDFDEKKVIGHGGEGKVYLAEIYLYSKTETSRVAVKHLNKDSKEFENEIRIVSTIKHPNLVSLLGYCNDSDKKILIYEYMVNGSLSDYVKMNSIVCLSWKQGLNICLGAAYGLQHLHKMTNERPKGIIHRDVKPANILLDQNWVAKVSDFGISKSSNPDQIISTILTNNIRGTPGYVAPEYNSTKKIKRSIDVYAFGMVMFEVLCRKKLWDRGDVSGYLEENEDLGDWARGNIDSIIKADIPHDSLKAFIDVTEKCLQSDQEERPTMDNVVLVLETALKRQEHDDELTSKDLRNSTLLLGGSPGLRIISSVIMNPAFLIAIAAKSIWNGCKPLWSSEQKVYDNSLARSTRDVLPAHFTLKIKSFSQLLQILSSSKTENYKSDIFEASGYKWKLCLYPYGNKDKNGGGHISLYLVIAETESLHVGWEVKVNFKMFLLDQVHATYSIFQDKDGKLYNFNKSDTQFGFDKLLPLNDFKDPSNGFLIRDKCVLGVEVFVWNNSGRGEIISSKLEVGATHTWRIDNFSLFRNEFHRSDKFILGNLTWSIRVYPKGCRSGKGKYVSLYLELNDKEMKGKAYVEYRLRIRDQLHDKHEQTVIKRWFSKSTDTWGLPQFLTLSDLENASKGFLVKDALIVEVEIISISSVKKLPQVSLS